MHYVIKNLYMHGVGY